MNKQMFTFIESKQATTLPFWTSTCGGGCANLHSVSVREHLLLWNSRQTSNVSHRESLAFGFGAAGTMTICAGLCTNWAMATDDGEDVSSVVVADAAAAGTVGGGETVM